MPDQLAEKEKLRLWLDAWKVADEEMDALKTRELQSLSEQDAARWFDALAWPAEQLWFSPERIESHGLIEQQRLFQRARQH